MKSLYRKILWFISFLGAFAVLVPIAVYLILSFYNLNQLKPLIEKVVTAQTGRAFIMHGNLSVAPGWSPTVRAENVTLKNPTWAKEPEFASIGALEINFELLPLLKRRVIIHDIHVKDAEFQLERGTKASQQSWRLVAEEDANAELKVAQKETGLKIIPEVAEIRLENVVLNYRQPTLETQKIALPMATLMMKDTLQLDVDYGYRGLVGSLHATGESLTAASQKGGIIRFETNTPQKKGSVRFDGALTDPVESPTLKGKLEVHADSLAAFQPFSESLQETSSLDLVANLSATSTRIKLSKMVLGILAQGDITGQADIRLSGIRPSLKADLVFPAVMLEPKDAAENPAAPMTNDGQKTIQETQTLIPDLPLPVGWMKALDAELNIAMPRFEYGNIALKNMTLTSVLKDGLLRVKPWQMEGFDGKLTSELTVDSQAKPPQFAVQFKGADWKLEKLISRPDNGSGRFTSGTAQLFVALKGAGDTMHPVIRSLAGTIGFSLTDVRYRSPAVAAALTDFFDLLRGNASGDVTISCALGRFDVKEGVATTQALGMVTKGAIVSGDGTIDFGEERARLVFSPRAKIIGLSDIAVPIRVSGNWQNLKVRPDARGTALKVGQVALGIATGGTSLGFAFLGKNITDKLGVTAENDPCSGGDIGNTEALPSGDTSKSNETNPTVMP
ncbi:MAG: AsmA family protein [Rickettsiales bacterium]|nr:AsmA family protein [Rickettsiales bacterium]